MHKWDTRGMNYCKECSVGFLTHIEFDNANVKYCSNALCRYNTRSEKSNLQLVVGGGELNGV